MRNSLASIPDVSLSHIAEKAHALIEQERMECEAILNKIFNTEVIVSNVTNCMEKKETGFSITLAIDPFPKQISDLFWQAQEAFLRTNPYFRDITIWTGDKIQLNFSLHGSIFEDDLERPHPCHEIIVTPQKAFKGDPLFEKYVAPITLDLDNQKIFEAIEKGNGLWYERRLQALQHVFGKNSITEGAAKATWHEKSEFELEIPRWEMAAKKWISTPMSVLEKSWFLKDSDPLFQDAKRRFLQGNAVFKDIKIEYGRVIYKLRPPVSLIQQNKLEIGKFGFLFKAGLPFIGLANMVSKLGGALLPRCATAKVPAPVLIEAESLPLRAARLSGAFNTLFERLDEDMQKVALPLKDVFTKVCDAAALDTTYKNPLRAILRHQETLNLAISDYLSGSRVSAKMGPLRDVLMQRCEVMPESLEVLLEFSQESSRIVQEARLSVLGDALKDAKALTLR